MTQQNGNVTPGMAYGVPNMYANQQQPQPHNINFNYNPALDPYAPRKRSPCCCSRAVLVTLGVIGLLLGFGGIAFFTTTIVTRDKRNDKLVDFYDALEERVGHFFEFRVFPNGFNSAGHSISPNAPDFGLGKFHAVQIDTRGQGKEGTLFKIFQNYMQQGKIKTDIKVESKNTGEDNLIRQVKIKFVEENKEPLSKVIEEMEELYNKEKAKSLDTFKAKTGASVADAEFLFTAWKKSNDAIQKNEDTCWVFGLSIASHVVGILVIIGSVWALIAACICPKIADEDGSDDSSSEEEIAPMVIPNQTNIYAKSPNVPAYHQPSQPAMV